MANATKRWILAGGVAGAAAWWTTRSTLPEGLASGNQLSDAEAAIDAANARIERVETRIDDAVLTNPVYGRVLYRLAEPGEVLSSGGRVPTLVDLTNVYIGIFLGTAARSMAQLALLIILVVLPLSVLSGGMTPIESQPDWLQPLRFLLPARHFVSFSQSILFRGAGPQIVWKEFATVTILGLACFVLSLGLFRRSIAAAR